MVDRSVQSLVLIVALINSLLQALDLLLNLVDLVEDILAQLLDHF